MSVYMSGNSSEMNVANTEPCFERDSQNNSSAALKAGPKPIGGKVTVLFLCRYTSCSCYHIWQGIMQHLCLASKYFYHAVRPVLCALDVTGCDMFSQTCFLMGHMVLGRYEHDG